MWHSCKKIVFDTFSVTTRGKFALKIMAAIAVFLYVTLVLCQNVNGYQGQKTITATTRSEASTSSTSASSSSPSFASPAAEAVSANNVIRLMVDSGSSDANSIMGLMLNGIGIKSKNNVKQQQKHQQINDEELKRPATATPKPPTTSLNDIFISVKTTKQNHDNRLELILNTWQQLAKQQTWFFTDDDDKPYQDRANGHLINTNCSNGHFRRALCCKMSTEFDMFIESRKKWFCHFDDDNYVNVPRLVSLLNEYSPTMEWYLGKPSVASPLEIHLEYKKRKTSDPKVRFWFATGGAGFCISRALALRMLPVAGGGKLISIGDRIRFPDDVTVGFIIEHLLGVPLTVVDQFHSHLEPMEHIGADTFRDQVSFSYGRLGKEWNVITIDSRLSKNEDPTRFRSLHCHLFSYLRGCES